MSSPLGPRIFRAPRRRAVATRRDSFAGTTCGRASGSGSSTRFRASASSATKRGWKNRGRTPATQGRGARCRPTTSWASSTSRPRCRPATTTAAIVKAPICSPTRSWRSTTKPASASGTTRPFITTCGTGTFRARQSSPTSTSTGRLSRPSPSPPSRRGCMCSTGPTAGPYGRLKSGRWNRERSPASGTRPRSRS